MSDFWPNELFIVKPFIMLEIGGQFQEKFVRVRLLNWGAVGKRRELNARAEGHARSQRPIAKG